MSKKISSEKLEWTFSKELQCLVNRFTGEQKDLTLPDDTKVYIDVPHTKQVATKFEVKVKPYRGHYKLLINNQLELITNNNEVKNV
jgi:hypothetical protein